MGVELRESARRDHVACSAMAGSVFNVRKGGSVEYEPPLRVRLSEVFGALCWCATPGIIVSLVVGRRGLT